MCTVCVLCVYCVCTMCVLCVCRGMFIVVPLTLVCPQGQQCVKSEGTQQTGRAASHPRLCLLRSVSNQTPSTLICGCSHIRSLHPSFHLFYLGDVNFEMCNRIGNMLPIFSAKLNPMSYLYKSIRYAMKLFLTSMTCLLSGVMH